MYGLLVLFPVLAEAEEMVTIPVAVLDQIEAEVAQQKILVQKLYDSEKKTTEINSALTTQNLSLTQDLIESENYCGKLENQVKLLKVVAWILGGATATLSFLEIIRSLAK